ncbi:MAG: nitrilase-related carbon-nitrogen hydrolase, partial [Pseudohongiellaceae bacterium]
MAAVVQMVSTGNVQANLTAAGRLIGEAAAAGAALVLLPENFAVLDGGPLSQYAEREGDDSALLQGFLREQARQHGIILVAGTMPVVTRPASPNGVVETIADGRVRPASL